MEESSIQRTADGKQDAARRRRPSEACAQRRRATLAGGELRPDLRPVPALCGTSLLRSARARGPDGGCTADSGGDDDAGAPAASRPPLGGRICSWWRSTARAEEPSPEATRVTCSCRIRCWALWLCK